MNLGNLITLVKGKKPENISVKSSKGFSPYVDIKAFETGSIDKYTDGKNCIECSDGDLLIVCDGSRSGLIGKAINGYVGSTLARIDVVDDIDRDYLYYFIQSKYVLLNKNVKGTGTPHLKQDLLKSFELFVPSIDKQKEIVLKIEESLSQLDSAVETLKKTKQQLEIYRQAVLKEAFSSDYPVVKVADLCEFITKGTTPPKNLMTAGYGEIPYIKVYNLTFKNTLDFTIEPTYVSKETHNSFLKRSITYPDDVLMNIVGPPMGKVSIVPRTHKEWNINQAIARFRCLDLLYNKYLAYYLGFSQTVERLKSKSKATAGQFNLTLEICRDIEIPLPELETQKKIVYYIETKLSQSDSIERQIEKSLQQAGALCQSMLKHAFEGE